ncbi:NUDIX hydrolase [Pseudolactococcus yaeyamensis]
MLKFTSKAAEKDYYEHQATEKEFLVWYAKQDRQTYETPSVTVDNVIFAYNPVTNRVNLLLIQRKAHPDLHHWALPGGFLDKTEDTTQAAIREVFEETHLQIDPKLVNQLKTIATPGRDPRGWVVTVAHLVYLPNFPQTQAGDDAARAQWFDFSVNSETHQLQIDGIPEQQLAFDHATILKSALQVIQDNFQINPKWLNLLPSIFSQQQVEVIAEQFKGDKISVQFSHYCKAYFVPADANKQDDKKQSHTFFSLKAPI